MNEDYFVYDKARDSVYRFSNGEIVCFADKNEAKADCNGNEIVVQYKDLPVRLKKEIDSY